MFLALARRIPSFGRSRAFPVLRTFTRTPTTELKTNSQLQTVWIMGDVCLMWEQRDPDLPDPSSLALYKFLTKSFIPIPQKSKAEVLAEKVDISRMRRKEEFLHAIRVLGVQGKLNDAEIAFATMQDRGIRPTVESYTTLLAACAEARRADRAEYHLAEMQKMGISPSIWTFSALALAYTRSDKLDDAYHVLERVSAAGLKPDNVLYTTLIHGSVRAGLVDRAWNSFLEMRKSVAEPDEVTFTVLLNACANRKQVERAMNLWNEMQLLKLQPTEVTYASMMHACACRSDYYEKTFELFEQMKNAGYKPDKYHYGSLLHACAQAGNVGDSQAVVLDMQRNGIGLNEVAFNTILNTYARAIRNDRATAAEHVPSAIQVFQDMQKRGIAPSIFTLHAMLMVYANARQIDQAVSFLQSFPQYHIQPTAMSYTIVMTMFAQMGLVDDCLNVYSELSRRFGKKDAYALSTLVSACVYANRQLLGVDVLREMRDLGLKPPPEHVTQKLLGVLRGRDAELLAWVEGAGRVDYWDKSAKKADAWRKSLLEGPAATAVGTSVTVSPALSAATAAVLSHSSPS